MIHHSVQIRPVFDQTLLVLQHNQLLFLFLEDMVLGYLKVRGVPSMLEVFVDSFFDNLIYVKDDLQLLLFFCAVILRC
jgi:hypothetical protein